MIYKKEDFLLSLEGLAQGMENPLATLANTAALIWQTFADINWAGFYLLDCGALWLGPFQGKPACTPIALGKGVCGGAFVQNQTIVVPDVHAFPGHIACDEASRSEIVVPLHANGQVIGVLDIDSPLPSRFDENDRLLLEAAVKLLENCCDFTRCGYTLHVELKDEHA